MKRSLAAIAETGGKLFIARRLPGGDMGEKWEFPGGKAEDGEDERAALLREMEEEFGVRIKVGEHIARGSFVHKGAERLLDAYRIVFPNFDFRLTEHSQWRWASIKEIEALNAAGEFTPSDYGLLSQIRAALGI